MKTSFLLFLILVSFTTYSQNSAYNLHIKRGIAFYDQGNYNSALAELQKAHSLDSSKIECYYYSGLVLTSLCHKTGNGCQGALEMLTTSININPSYRHAYYNRGVCLLRLGSYKNALADFKAAIRLDNIDGDAFCNKGLSEIKLGLKKEGCLDIKTGVSLGSKQGQSMLNLCN